MSSLSRFLFARPSFLEGFARTLDMAGTLNLYNYSTTEKQADSLALRADWRAVGEDIRKVEYDEYLRLLTEELAHVQRRGEPVRS